MRRLVIAAGILVTSTVLVTGCKSSTVSTTPVNTSQPAVSRSAVAPSTSSSAANAGVGSAIDIAGSSGGDELEVTVVKVADPDSSANEFSSPPAGDRYVSVQFQILDSGTGNYQDDPMVDISATDSSGQTMQLDLGAMTTAGAQLPSSLDLTPGEKSLGFATFDVPKDDTIAQVQYALNGGMFGNAAQWQVK
jgi:Domain of unknown function (DUF4352)